ncbi:hypothetical protein P2G88_12670 [Aliiglaciecola sp. CAU 1673]|uniref:hypothetical protein n=1 Tax=Aliiglaciecola sp. CAU 1673 TaxID=3032595 RepID=UPI0023DB3773|nr:hypothetical protein [Aliiglaciecola sp. CAU 1673]MDF2179105.1 hypothetical protein [Aliiglaciecola sp. CAU 1673]
MWAFNPFLDLALVKSGEQLAELVRYLTFMEGAAVYAAYAARQKNHHLSEHDFQALKDDELMQNLEEEYFAIYRQVQNIGQRPLTPQDWDLLDPLSDGKRLWYRVGAKMCEELDSKLGRDAFLQLIRQGPDAFFTAYHSL